MPADSRVGAKNGQRSRLADRALSARRESRRIALRRSFEVNDDLLRDVAAMANSGGGAIVFRDGQVEAAAVADAFGDYTDFSDLQVAGTALIVGEAITPIVIGGVVYVRHGVKSQPATTEDLAAAIDRRVEMVRDTWLSAITTFVKSPVGAATPIRIVNDPRAPAYGVVDYDKTHPYRAKELLGAFNARHAGAKINQFDLLAVRKTHEIDSNGDFSHKTLFGARQYSEKFLQWLLDRARRDPEFFVNARREYQRR